MMMMTMTGVWKKPGMQRNRDPKSGHEFERSGLQNSGQILLTVSECRQVL